MSLDHLDQFDICSKIDTNLRKDIKCFHVFDDVKGFNVLFITNNDLVYGYGKNTKGCCGLGHNNMVNEPEIIPELCHQNIKQFSIGFSFISALNNEGKVFAWGCNDWGQLGRGFASEIISYLKPSLVNIKDKIIEQVQCGSAYCLVLDIDGYIYSWGANDFGQIGCGPNKGKLILIPTKVKSFSNSKIQYIYCSYNRSFALTFDGLVYSWGENQFCDLGHDSEKEKFICEPKLIEIKNVKNICFGGRQTYFLTNEGQIYFCGKYIDDNNCESFTKIPKLLYNEIEFISLQSIPSYQKRIAIPIGVNNEGIYQLYYHNLIKTKYNSMFEFYAEEYKICFKTIDNSFDDFYEHIFQVNNENHILDQLERFSKNSRFKENIKALHIFNDRKGSNAFLITSDDKVFSFGSNFYGVCGFGHDHFVEKPTVITELINKNIKKFIIRMSFVLAQDNENNVYGWGGNIHGELGIGISSAFDKFLKPKNILFPKSENIIQISCGSIHSLALTSNGKIYGWGSNEWGQVGCAKQYGRIIAQPLELKIDLRFKSIYCSFHNSFAVTINGLVYSWGENQFCYLGHELDINEKVFEPKLIINLLNVINVCKSSLCTYFLTNEENIYFCGQFSDENNVKKYQKLPKLLDSEIKFQSLHSVSDYINRRDLGIALKDGIIYKLYENRVEKTNYNNLLNYYKTEYKLTHKTVYMNEIIWSQNENTSESQNINSEIINLSNNCGVNLKFKILCELGSGAFATVLKVEEILGKRLYALKKISIKDQENIVKLEREVNVMRDLSEEFVVKYYNSGIEGNNFYIQMELCSQNFGELIETINKSFDEKFKAMKYFIRSQLLVDLIECLNYLHKLNIIHRDLKPSNIVVTDGSNGRFLKLCDFGLAKVYDNSLNTLAQGTLRYIAPEVLIYDSRSTDTPKARYNHKCDVFSLGVIAINLFDFKDDIKNIRNICNSDDYLNTGLEESLIKLLNTISRMIAINPEERPNCEEFLKESSEWTVDQNKVSLVDNYSQLNSNSNIPEILRDIINTKLNKAIN